MKLLTSKKLKLPEVFFVSNKEDIKEVPIGVPFIFGDPSTEDNLIRILEYEVLYQEALRSGYGFNFRKILLDNGFSDLIDFGYGKSVYMEYTTEGLLDKDFELEELHLLDGSAGRLKDYIRDSSTYVDIQKLKDLNVFPVWLDTIEKAIHTNIHNFATFNNNMYNKKLEGMYGGLELTPPSRNLIIIDISGSIPRAVSATCLILAKNLSETFYADLLITGSKSTLYEYGSIHTLDTETIYEQNGMDNDQVYFRKLLSEEARDYNTAIVFGDDDSPCRSWSNKYNEKSKTISEEDGKKLCQWTVNKLISFHTNTIERDAAYATWFEPKETERIDDWVKYL